MVKGTDKNTYTVEEIVNEIAEKPSILNIAIFAGLMFFMTICAISAFFPNFGGYLPYSEWRCMPNSTECLERTKNLTYDKDKMCGTKGEETLIAGKDFYWSTNGRTTFAIDWDLTCGGEFSRTMLGSVYFGGAIVGTFGGGTLYDIIGRKKGALVGYIVVIVSAFASAASPSVDFFFFCRFLQGVGVVLGFTGIYVLLLEYSAAKYRNVVNSAFQFSWALGYVLTTILGYFIKSWNWLAGVTGILYVLALGCLLLVPESPRYYRVNKNNEELAKESLKWLKKINKHDLDIDSVRVSDTQDPSEPEMGFLATIRDFVQYRELTIQLVIQMWLWMVCGFLYYGFSFSWSKLGHNLYLSYLYASIGEVLAYLGMTFPVEYLGRKISMMIFLSVASVSFLFAMIPSTLGSSFSVEQLSCLIGTMFVSAAFGSVYLYTIELAPTSHRGKMVGYCNFAARIGAFCGPQAEILFSWNKTGTLILFTVLAALAGLCNLRLPTTKDVPTPNTGLEVQQRRDGKVGVGGDRAAENTVLSNIAHSP